MYLRILDVYPRSPIRVFSIPDLNCFHPRSRICIKEFKYFNPTKWFLSSRKHDPDPQHWFQMYFFALLVIKTYPCAWQVAISITIVLYTAPLNFLRWRWIFHCWLSGPRATWRVREGVCLSTRKGAAITFQMNSHTKSRIDLEQRIRSLKGQCLKDLHIRALAT
jgi:hypothetical protein